MAEARITYKDTMPGAGVTLAVAAIAMLASFAHPSFDPLVLSIVFGLLVSNLLGDREYFEKGVEFALRLALPLGIGLYGIQLNFTGLDVRMWPAVGIIFALTYGITYLVSKGFGLGRMLSLLLCTGLSVCGASAIAVVAPLLGSKKEETTISIIAVVCVGLTGMIIYRLSPDFLGISAEPMSFLIGMTLPMLGQVKIAAQELGPDAGAMATNFKLMRVSALLVVAAVIVLTSRKEKKGFPVPWFMIVFFALAALANFGGQWAMELKKAIAPVAAFLLTVALSAIGMSMDFDSITSKGASPLFAAFIAWGIVALAVYLGISALW